MRDRRVVVGLLALAGAAPGACLTRSTPKASHAAAAVTYDVRTLELANGLSVVLERAPDFGAAAAVLVVGAGSADEPPGKAGLAHLTEHLQGSATHAGVSFLARVRELDGSTNASTSWDDTTYRSVGDVRFLESTLAFLYGVLEEPLAGVDESTFAREWRAVSNERRLRTEEGTPGQSEGWLMAATFQANHPYAHPVVGTAASLGQVALADVRAFVADRYRFDRSTLVVSAPLSLDAQQALVERIAGQPARARGDRAPGTRPPAATSAPASFRRYQAEVSTPTLWVGWAVTGAYGEESDVAPLLAAIARTSASIDLGERDRDVGTVETGVIPGAAASLLYARITLKEAVHPEASARAVEDEMLGGLGKLTEREAPLEVMARLVGTEYAYDDEDLLGRTLHLAASYEHLGSPTFLRRRGERMAALSASDVLGFARAFLSPERAHVILVEPGRPEAGPEAVPPPAAPTPAAEAAPIAAHPSVWAPVLTAPGPRPEGPRPLEDVETRRLSNGLEVILLPRAGAPFHTVLLGFKGGRAQGTPPGVTWATNWARQSAEWSPRLWGVDYRTHVTETATLEVLKGPRAEIRQTLKYLRRVMGFSIFWPPRRFNQRVEVFEREDQEPSEVLHRSLARAIYGSGPLGAWPTARQLQKITPAEVMAWNDRVRRPTNAALVIVGDFEPAEVFAAAEDELGSWGANASAKAPLDDPPTLAALEAGASGRAIIQDRPGAQQSTVRLDCVLPPASPDSYAADAVFAHGLKKALFADLRQEVGASYSVSGGVDVLPGGTAVLRLSADVDTQLLPEVLRRLRRMIAHPETVTSDSATFDHTRGTAAGRFRVDAATTESTARLLFETWNRRWPLEAAARLPDQALAASPEAVETAASRCRDNWAVGLLGDRSRLRAAWDASAP